MKVGALIQRLQLLQAEHGDVPVYLVTDEGEVLAAGSTGCDCYEQAEGVVVEIIAEGETS